MCFAEKNYRYINYTYGKLKTIPVEFLNKNEFLNETFHCRMFYGRRVVEKRMLIRIQIIYQTGKRKKIVDFKTWRGRNKERVGASRIVSIVFSWNSVYKSACRKSRNSETIFLVWRFKGRATFTIFGISRVSDDPFSASARASVGRYRTRCILSTSASTCCDICGTHDPSTWRPWS